jgi:adhesin/invasin
MNPNSAATNSSGQVTSVYISSTTSGWCKVTATEANTGGSGSATLDQLTSPAPLPTYAVTTLTFVPTHVPADGATTATATANVKQTVSLTPISGDTVRFTTGAGCTGVLLNGGSSATATTDSNGNASVTYTAGTTVGTCSITATEANTGHLLAATETQDVVPNTITASANPTNIPANGTSSSVISITVIKANGTAANGDVVTLTASTVAGQNDCGSFPATATTNASGQATVVYISTSTPGFCTINLSDPSNGAPPAVATSVTIQQHA